VLRAINEGVPFVQSAPASPLSLEVGRLASWLVKDSADEEPEALATAVGNNKISRWMRPLPRRRAG
jgi:MinD-like ATPase involved in chromosome partitioning or flagellar assembly